MNYIEAPGSLGGLGRGRLLFVGGGITDCPDWQAELVKHLEVVFESNSVTVLNPRRANFPMGDDKAGQEQVMWEHRALRLADVICFWFPKETLCPITLYELGYWSAIAEHEVWDKCIVIGCDPEYKRLFDVRLQTELSLPGVVVHTDFDSFVDAVAFAL